VKHGSQASRLNAAVGMEGSGMDVWQLILYGVASFLALKSLLTLMEYHRRRYTQQVLSKRQAQQKRTDQQRSQEADDEVASASSDSAA